ncbi:MAG: formyl transferase [Tildeniella torsiva UHER 1998/13D]|jgi:methionyl-tRNA formyltransferase|nr:formyl transferase [Tildeniella torsiva UHER 1998/13D]
MQILYLGKDDPRVIDILSRYGDRVLVTDQRISRNHQDVIESDFLVSYGYRYILKEDVLSHFDKSAINVHISYLPWNRGADPNLWSFLEDTPKGVSIHYLNSGIDTGNILFQEHVNFDESETLKTSYDRLSEIAIELLDKNWQAIRSREIPGFEQSPGGSFHRLADKQTYLHLLNQGWDTSVEKLTGKALLKRQ